METKKKLLNTISASDQPNEFAYVPEFYVESLIDCFHAVRRSQPPLRVTEAPLQAKLLEIVTFFVNHFADKRIINPELRDVLLQSISVLLQYEDYFKVFEDPSNIFFFFFLVFADFFGVGFFSK